MVGVAHNAPVNGSYYSGYPAATFNVVPDLPAGLELNSTTGAISGSAVNISHPTSYTVYANNSAGYTVVTIVIIVQGRVSLAALSTSAIACV